MECSFLVMCLYFLFEVVQIVSGIDIVVGTFRVLRKHPQILQCAETALRKNVYAGARISDQTGVCERLSYSWGRNQSIESGYGYVRKIHTRLKYQPPIDGKQKVNIPGVLDKGAKLDIHLTWENTTASALFVLSLWAMPHPSRRRIYYSLYYSRSEVEEFYRIYNDKWFSDKHADFPLQQEFRESSNRLKISFVAQRNTLHFLVADRLVSTVNLTEIRLNHVEKFSMDTNSLSGTLDIPIMEVTEA